MKAVLSFFILLVLTSTTQASWFDKKISGRYLYDVFRKQGVPKQAVERVFEFLDLNADKKFKLKLNEETTTKKIANKDYAVIVDFSKPSSEKRLYFMNLKNGGVEKYYVAHGVNSGEDRAVSFSNEIDSRKSSLGFYITGSIYTGKHGESLYLHGLEKTNDLAFKRDIVMHGAKYVSLEFLEKYGRMGRSWGCPAVSEAVNKKLLPLIKGGAVFYAYHKELVLMTQARATIQNVRGDQRDTSENGHNVVFEELDP
ncbi:murein L,D-transpeptidase catalytic domain family protein [Bdellovibrio sp. 22V]|uniref:murein L,D-transpeptidase catalytic domain family protein n=1 Tax=Bdellovibrio TaxID=958 RepID=UPI002543EA9E|nr:murein L,D-transpeptidase catalytic domain family protein [Bdellovibrio sp. 22V]WII70868.1 murein L,D-transpeptidase catalytic domain family protein [Bdellovibrio sp. 22V]